MASKHIDCSRFLRPVRYVLLQSFVSCFSVLSILLFARRKRSIPHHPECMGVFFARRSFLQDWLPNRDDSSKNPAAICIRNADCRCCFSESGRSQNISAVCKTDFAVAFSSLLICRLKLCLTYEKESTVGNRPPGKFGGVADTDCERLTEYGTETVSVPSRW